MSTTHAHLVERATLEAKHVDDVDRDALLERLDAVGFVRVTGLVGRDEMQRCLDRMRARLDPSLDHATTGEPPEAIRRNFQKWSIGRGPHASEGRARMMRTLYNPLWDEDVYGLHDVFRRQCRLRNRLAGLPPDYAIDAPEDGLFTAARVHHYPSGGGFMAGHVDSIIPSVYAGSELGFHNTLLLVTEKGRDYHAGGGFIEIDGEHVVYDDHCRAGDVLVYDQRLVHGVDDVDPTVPFRADSLAGRVTGFVSFFELR